MTDADLVRSITAPLTVQALTAAAAALDERPRLLATIAGLETSVADLRRQLGATRTLWGSSVWTYSGETQAQAVARVDKAIGPLQIVRHFCSGAPVWPTVYGTRQLHLSFKLPPAEVLAGMHDAKFRSWCAAAPDRDTLWTYWHEPEDDVERGDFAATQYRAAFRRLAGIAKTSGKRLLATPVLMGWTVNPASGRAWRVYYPGDDVVDVIGFDSYLLKGMKTIGDVFAHCRRVATELGKPWTVAETGVAADQLPLGMTRAGALTALARDARTVAPVPFAVCYFDSPVGNASTGWPITKDATASAAWVAGRTG